jgi:hypothetical protein
MSALGRHRSFLTFPQYRRFGVVSDHFSDCIEALNYGAIGQNQSLGLSASRFRRSTEAALKPVV